MNTIHHNVIMKIFLVQWISTQYSISYPVGSS